MTSPAPHALPSATPHAIRDELTEMVVKDLLGPAGGPNEELDQREDRVTGRYLVGMLAPKSTTVEAEEQDTLGTDQTDDRKSVQPTLPRHLYPRFFPTPLA